MNSTFPRKVYTKRISQVTLQDVKDSIKIEDLIIRESVYGILESAYKLALGNGASEDEAIVQAMIYTEGAIILIERKKQEHEQISFSKGV